MDTPSIGAPPYPNPLPTGDEYDPDLLEHGDSRNVIDKYRYWTIKAIKADLDKTRVDVHIAIENYQHDMNIGTIVRNANAFNVAAVHIIGMHHWNKRGAMVTDKYLDVFYHKTAREFASDMGDRHIIAVDNLPGAVNLSEVTLPTHAVLVFGSEGPGLSDEMVQASEMMVKIEQFGSTRSVNVGVASGIVLYQWTLENSLTHYL